MCPATKAGRCQCRGFWTTTPPFGHADRSSDVSRWKVGRVALEAKSCANPRSTTVLSNRAWDLPQVCEGTIASSGRTHRNRRCPGRVIEKLLCPGNSASPWFAASCCRDGSLAVIQPIWVHKTSEVSSTCGNVRRLLAGDVHSPVQAFCVEKEGSCHPAPATAPMLVGRDHKTGVRDGSVLMCQTRDTEPA